MKVRVSEQRIGYAWLLCCHTGEALPHTPGVSDTPLWAVLYAIGAEWEDGSLAEVLSVKDVVLSGITSLDVRRR